MRDTHLNAILSNLDRIAVASGRRKGRLNVLAVSGLSFCAPLSLAIHIIGIYKVIC